MDPISAVVAFTGYSASLITILGAICKFSRTLIDFQKKLKEAPRKVPQLHRDLENLRALVEAIHVQFSSDESTDYPSALRGICENLT
jgi:hypothetical protein